MLNLQRFANGALACHELGWRPAEARVLLQKGAYLWRLMHEAPDRTRRLYEEMHNAPPLKGKAVNRAATAPWLEAVHGELERVLGEDATVLCRELGKKEWKARLTAAVDTAYNDHWLSKIRAKLAKPTTASASLMPAEYVGKVVHKTAQEFGTDDDDTVYSGVVVSYNADALKWTVQYDHGAPLTTEEYTQQQVTTHHRGVLRDEDSGDEVHRDMLRRYLRCAVSCTGAWYLKGEEATPPAIARWHAHARTNGGLASAYGRVGPEGREHCAACAGMPETTMHVYRQCPRYAAPRAHLTRAVDEWCTDATTGGARPTREDALRWVHDNAMADGSCAPLAATLAGDVLRTAAYTFWKAARKLRWVCKGIRTGSGLEARPQAAADGAREAATPTANAAGLQPTQDDGAETPSDHQQPQAPGAATRAL